MKKLLTASAITCLLAVSAFAQGTVDFRNRIAGTLDVPVFDVGGTTKLAGANFTVNLWYSATLAGTYTMLDPLGAGAMRTGAGAGYWTYGADFARTIPGIAPGATAYIQVRVWDSTSGATYDAAVTAGGKVGQSTAFSVVLGNVGSPPSVPAYMLGFTGLTMTQVPEPATFALLALGAGALLIRRRK